MKQIKPMAITYVVLVTLIIAFPPVYVSPVAGRRGSSNRGFSAVWDVPSGLSINIPFLLVELFALTAICAVIYFFVVKRK